MLQIAQIFDNVYKIIYLKVLFFPIYPTKENIFTINVIWPPFNWFHIFSVTFLSVPARKNPTNPEVKKWDYWLPTY